MVIDVGFGTDLILDIFLHSSKHMKSPSPAARGCNRRYVTSRDIRACLPANNNEWENEIRARKQKHIFAHFDTLVPRASAASCCWLSRIKSLAHS